MRDVTNANFGILVAYLLPGFVALLGLSQSSESVRSWVVTPPIAPPTIGGFLYLTLACLGSGLVVSTVRWAMIDTLHHATGIRPPEWNFAHLEQKLDAFQLLVESHYRFYQFYANTAVAGPLAYGVWRINEPYSHHVAILDIGFVIVECLLVAGSRDTLRKYYARGEALLGC